MQENLLKITNAVYKILDFLPDSDPLKNKAKEKALVILELGNSLPENSENFVKEIELLESYLAIGKTQGWVDAMNFLIITKEYRQVKEHISLPGQVVKKPLINTSLTNAPNPTKAESILTGRYSKRQDKILEIFSQKEKLQVQDIIREIPDVTKRTLRRDLDDLLKNGEIVRIGEFSAVFYQKVDRTS